MWFKGLIAVLLIVGVSLVPVHPAIALIQEHQEAPGQVLYKSVWSLRDDHQHPWQAIVFKYTYPDRQMDGYLRLVGFPGAVSLDHAQPLRLIYSPDREVRLPDESGPIFKEGRAPEPAVGQYNLQAVLDQLPTDRSLDIILPTLLDGEMQLHIPLWLVQEWQTVLRVHSP